MKKIISIGTLFLATSLTYAMSPNYSCPDARLIQSTDFTAPSVWVAPPVTHSRAGLVGVGLGGKRAVRLIGAERATIGHRDGWVCVYESKGGVSIRDYESKIREMLVGNKFIGKRFIGQVEKAFADAEPYLSHYPTNRPIGVIGYQAEYSDDGEYRLKK